ncbi:MAG: hypothetical protein LQ342_002570 [Letrouitia transgressa]|nr:MAG: hypothetical protein LQ342_002570 [Letrouitia transgressa]
MSGKDGAIGNFAYNAIASWPPGETPKTTEDEVAACKIARAMLSGPPHITKDAAVIDDTLGPDGSLLYLRHRTDPNNNWTLMPGNENKVGAAPMCADPHGMGWAMSIMMDKPYPENTEPGIIYMLCGATQHSNTNALDKTSPGIPIGPHWMIVWPYDQKNSEKNFTATRIGIPNTVRDAGAWQMFDNTPYAYTHICGNPWVGREYDPDKTKPVWTMQYQPS